jgi:hypothetical protein
VRAHGCAQHHRDRDDVERPSSARHAHDGDDREQGVDVTASATSAVAGERCHSGRTVPATMDPGRKAAHAGARMRLSDARAPVRGSATSELWTIASARTPRCQRRPRREQVELTESCMA